MFDSKVTVCKWLCKFVAEVCKSDASEYTPRSIYLLLAGLQRSIWSHQKEEINIFSDHKFKELKKVYVAVFKRVHSKGIGSTMKSAAALGPEEKICKQVFLVHLHLLEFYGWYFSIMGKTIV